MSVRSHPLCRLFWVLAAALTLLATGHRATAAPGDADPGFAPVFDTDVIATVVQPDGKILVAGNLGMFGPSGKIDEYLARLNPDGTRDPTFFPAVDQAVLNMAVQGDGKIVIVGQFQKVNGVGRNYVARLNADGSLDATFNPSADDSVQSVAIQNDGAIIIGGNFTTLGGVARHHVARLNADGSLDATFNPDANDQVATIFVQLDGGILIGGYFTSIGTATRNHIARLTAAGALDSFDPNADGPVLSLAVLAAGQVALGGGFTRVSDTTRSGLALVTASGDLFANFNPGLVGDVLTIAIQADQKILVGGTFNFIDGEDTGSLVRLNTSGGRDTSFNAGVDDNVDSIAVLTDGRVVIGGSFFQAGGVSRKYAALLQNDGAGQLLGVTSVSRLEWDRNGASPESNQVTFDLSTDGGYTYARLGAGTRLPNGWELTGLSLPSAGHLRARARLSQGGMNGGNGVIESTIAFGLPATPEIAIDLAGTDLTNGSAAVAFGNQDISLPSAAATLTIHNTGGSALNLGALTLDGNNASDFLFSLPATATLSPGRSITIPIVFYPTTVGGKSATLHIPSNDADEATFNVALTGTGVLSANANLSALEVSGTDLVPAFAPGTTSYAASVPFGFSSVTVHAETASAFATVKVNGGSVDSSGDSGPVALNVGDNAVPVVVTAQNGTTKTYTVTVTRGAAGPGDVNPAFNPALDGEVLAAVPQPDGKVLIAGAFTNHLVRLNADGSLDGGFQPTVDGQVRCLAVQADGKILLGGDFANVGAEAHPFVARLNGNGTPDSDFHPQPNGSVNGIALQENGKIVLAGLFDSVGSAQVKYLARLEANGGVDAGFNAQVDAPVQCLLVQADQSIVFGGNFTHVQSVARGHIARVSAAGVLDTGFDPEADDLVNALVQQADGKLLVGGPFEEIGGGEQFYLARLGTDGRLDASFTPKVNDSVLSIALQADGSVVAGGVFTFLGGTDQSYVGRFSPAGELDATFAPAVSGFVQSTALGAHGEVLIGGDFMTVDELSHPYFAQLFSSAAAESLTVSSFGVIQWLRGGSAPELEQVTYELSTDSGNSYAPLGSAGRVPGGWQFAAPNLPMAGELRARGRTVGGNNNGSRGLVETIIHFSVPVLQIELAGVILVDGGPAIDFGSAVVGGNPVVKTFIVRNTGGADLMLQPPTRDGVNKVDFTASATGNITVSAGGTTTFTVTFAPTGSGPRTAGIHLGSNTTNTVFDLNVSGTGVPMVLPAVVTGAASNITNTGATLGGTVDAKGGQRAISFDYGLTTQYGSSVAAMPSPLSGSGATAVSANLAGLRAHTVYHYRVRAAGELGTATGADKTFTTGNTAPVAVNDALAVVPPGAVLEVLANDTDADGDTLTVTAKSAVTGTGSVSLAGGKLFFTTPAGFTGGSFSYTIKDGFGGTATATVNVTATTLSIMPASKSVAAAGGTYAIGVSTSGAFSVSESLSWVTVSATANSVQVTVAPNSAKTARTGTLEIGDQTHTITQAGVDMKPVLGPLNGSPFAAIVSGAFSLPIPTTNGPVTYTATKLPPGLKLSNSTGILSGTPTTPGTYQVTVNAKNAIGSAAPLSFTINVAALAPGTVGTFHGIVGRQPVLNGNLASRLILTTTKTGTYSGKIVTGTKSTSFKGQLAATPADLTRASLTLAIPALKATLALTLDDPTDSLVGTLSDGTNTTAVHGWRNAWKEVDGKAADFAGRHSFSLEQPDAAANLPQGLGYGAFTVNGTTGALTISGKLADGSAFMTATFVGQHGEVLLYGPLYSGRGSVAGELVITRGAQAPVGNTIAGASEAPIDWLKPAPAATSKDTVYRAGFGPIPLTAPGGLYTPPAPGQLVLGLTAGSNNAKLEFADGGLEGAFEQPLTISAPSATSNANQATVPTNASLVTITTLNSATGAFAGSFTIVGATKALDRKAPFSGQLVTSPSGSKGYGFFLLPTVPATGQTVTTSPKLSGSVVLEAP